MTAKNKLQLADLASLLQVVDKRVKLTTSNQVCGGFGYVRMFTSWFCFVQHKQNTSRINTVVCLNGSMIKLITRSLPKAGVSILKTPSLLQTLTHTKITQCRDLVCLSGRYDFAV